MDVIHLLVSRENFNTSVFDIILSANEDKRKPGKLQNFWMYGVKERVVYVIYIKCIEVFYISVDVWYMGDEYEESQKCLSELAERSCLFLYCIWIILGMYIFYCIFRALAN
jgi:hypothetical protein